MAAVNPVPNDLLNEPEIVQVAAIGDDERLVELLEQDIDVDTVSEEEGKPTPLAAAVMYNQIECTDCLLDHHADLETRCEYQDQPEFTPFLIAAQNANADMLKLLVSRGAIVNVIGGDDSIEGGVALEAIDIVVPDTPAYQVVAAINTLLQCVISGKPNKDNAHSLYEAMYACVQNGASVHQRYEESDNNSYSMLHLAIASRNLSAVHALLRLGADVNALDTDAMTPVMLATKLGLLSFVKAFFEIRSNNLLRFQEQAPDGTVIPLTDTQDRTCLMLATRHVEVARYLIEVGKLPIDESNRWGVTPFMYAATHGHLDFIKYLFESPTCTVKPDVDTQDHKGRTALIRALRFSHSQNNPAALVALHEMIKYLVEVAHVNVEMNDHDEKLALDMARDRKIHKDIQNYLQANLNLLDFARGELEIKSLSDVLQAGAYIHARGSVVDNDSGEIQYSGVQAIHLAIISGSLERTKSLLIQGANLEYQDDSGCSALDYAVRRGDESLLSLCITYPLTQLQNSGSRNTYIGKILNYIEENIPNSLKLSAYYHLGCFLLDEVPMPSVALSVLKKGATICLPSDTDFAAEIQNRLAEMALAGFHESAMLPLPGDCNEFPAHIQSLDEDVEMADSRMLEANFESSEAAKEALLFSLNAHFKPQSNPEHTRLAELATRSFFALAPNDPTPVVLTSSAGIVQLATTYQKERKKSLQLEKENELLKKLLAEKQSNFLDRTNGPKA